MRKPEFIYVTYIETTPEKLWEALTNSEFSRRYWWGTEVKSDWKVGSPFALVMNGTTTDVAISCILRTGRAERFSPVCRLHGVLLFSVAPILAPDAPVWRECPPGISSRTARAGRSPLPGAA